MLVLLVLACFRAAVPTTCDPPGTQVPEPRAGGCAVVVDHTLLLVQGLNGRWTIPGGYVDRGEDSAAAAVRETWEEAGLRVRAEAPVCAVPTTRFVAHRCVPTGDAPPSANGDETRDARFFGRAEIEALADDALRFPDQRAAYLRFLDP